VSVAPGSEVVEGSGAAARWALAGALGGVALGAILLVAAALKALDPHLFAEEIASQRAGFGLPPLLAAYVALGVETALGSALVLNLRRLPVLVAATLLVAFFLFLTGRFAWQAAHGEVDPASSCGCFGSLVERTPGEAFVQDLAMLVPTLALAWTGRAGARRSVKARAVVAGAATFGLVGFAVAAPGLPLDDWATRLRPGVELAELCAGAGDARVCLPDVAAELAEGSHLVVIAADEPGFADLASRLNAYVRSGAEPPVAVLADLTAEQLQAIYWEHAPAFELHETPQALLRPLYRRLPRSFAVERGRVTATWNGLPPALTRDPTPNP